MTDPQRVRVVKSDIDQIIDLVTALVGLGVLWYTQNPEPFERAAEKVHAFAYAWVHRMSVWEARQAIRSLPETDEPS